MSHVPRFVDGQVVHPQIRYFQVDTVCVSSEVTTRDLLCIRFDACSKIYHEFQ